MPRLYITAPDTVPAKGQAGQEQILMAVRYRDRWHSDTVTGSSQIQIQC
jgi:hypothetical protein